MAGSIASPHRVGPPLAAQARPLSRTEVAEVFGPRCQQLLQPYAVAPEGWVGPTGQWPFWLGYTVSLRTLALELRVREVHPDARPAVDRVVGALAAQALSIERELQVWSAGVPDDSALAGAVRARTVVREEELLAAFDELGLEACASYRG
ncbi:hypothetical protein [Kineococcus indalonis]|uniref:hypothetical protein n=1 Tax=Kineococcus indalonis TaxID=2696566 RepID=UPI00141260A0|nr:hypothetical protein [Kineococcus indalonis]NAZ85425.1 hypothetical protein [Kineococcus indalonis]